MMLIDVLSEEKCYSHTRTHSIRHTPIN